MKRRRYIYIALSLVTVVGVLGTVALGLMAGSAKGEEDDLRAQIAAKQAELQKIKSGDVEAEKERLAELEAELEVPPAGGRAGSPREGPVSRRSRSPRLRWLSVRRTSRRCASGRRHAMRAWRP